MRTNEHAGQTSSRSTLRRPAPVLACAALAAAALAPAAHAEPVWTTVANWTEDYVERNVNDAVTDAQITADGQVRSAQRKKEGAEDASPDTATWSPLRATAADVTDISCPTTTTCVVIDRSNGSRATHDGGATWQRGEFKVRSGFLRYATGVSCATALKCVAVGYGGTIGVSDDGGVTWSYRDAGTDTDFKQVSCPTESDCFAVGTQLGDPAPWKGLSRRYSETTIVATSDGGASWSTKRFSTAATAGEEGSTLIGISCPTASDCVAAGGWQDEDAAKGEPRGRPAVVTTSDGGATWTARSLDLSGGQHLDAYFFYAVACATPSDCRATTHNGKILTSRDGGATWAREYTGAEGATLIDLDCPTSTHCIAAGYQNKFLSTRDGGESWQVHYSPHVLARTAACARTDPRYCWGAGEPYVGRDGVVARTPGEGPVSP